MTKLEGKFWDAAITEAATRRRPPDQADQILMRLQIPDLGPPKSERKARVFKLRRVLEVGAAAAALIAIGILTGLIPLGGDSPDKGLGPEPEPSMIAAAPGTEFETHEHHVELKDGWLLVTTGAPDVHCEGSTLTNVDGRVLVHAGSMPTGAQAKSVADWLKANELEQEMIGNSKRWITTATLAVLVLAGSAQLDGQRIEAEEEAPVATPVPWYPVQSVMDIETLPKDVRWVDISELKAAHLEFVSKHPHVVGINARYLKYLEGSHLDALVKMENLEYLDISGVSWSGEIDYRPLKALTSLKELVIDYTPNGDPDADNYHVVETLKHLMEQGTRVYLGNMHLGTEALLNLLDEVPGITDLDLTLSTAVNNPAVLKRLAEVASLKSLTLFTDDLGLAYLAKSPSLESLTVTSMVTEAILYQLGKFQGLKTLEIVHANAVVSKKGPLIERGALGSEVSHLDQLSNLRTLKIDWGPMASNRDETTFQHIADIIDGIPALETLEFTRQVSHRTLPKFLQQLNGISVRNLVFKVDSLESFLPYPENDGENELITPFQDVQYLSISLGYYSDFRYEEASTSYGEVLSKLIGLFPNLKSFRHGVERVSNPDVEGLETAIEHVREVRPELTIDAFHKVWNR